ANKLHNPTAKLIHVRLASLIVVIFNMNVSMILEMKMAANMTIQPYNIPKKDLFSITYPSYKLSLCWEFIQVIMDLDLLSDCLLFSLNVVFSHSVFEVEI